jgi:SAM-dependent methyltransferase
VLNVGAGSGSYEPTDLPVVAVEPSHVMLHQRPAGAGPAVQAVAERLPFRSGDFAAGMAILTVHHWADVERGLAELRRVVRGRIAVLTWDQAVFASFWLAAEYVPASLQVDHNLPTPVQIAELLGGGAIEAVPIPHDCTDGFFAAYWRRPEAYLDPAVRNAISALARLTEGEIQPGLDRLARDLATGVWHREHAALLECETYDAGYRLVISSGT